MTEPTTALAFGGPLHGRMLPAGTPPVVAPNPGPPPFSGLLEHLIPHEETVTYRIRTFVIWPDPDFGIESHLLRVWTTTDLDAIAALHTCLAIGALARYAAGWRPTP